MISSTVIRSRIRPRAACARGSQQIVPDLVRRAAAERAGDEPLAEGWRQRVDRGGPAICPDSSGSAPRPGTRSSVFRGRPSRNSIQPSTAPAAGPGRWGAFGDQQAKFIIVAGGGRRPRSPPKSISAYGRQIVRTFSIRSPIRRPVIAAGESIRTSSRKRGPPVVDVSLRDRTVHRPSPGVGRRRHGAGVDDDCEQGESEHEPCRVSSGHAWLQSTRMG